MARFWQKKRGQRTTVTKLFGGVGEVLFFALVFVVGIILLAVLVTLQVSFSLQGEPYYDPLGFWLRMLVVISLVGVGGLRMIMTVWQLGTSAERRSAFVNRAAEAQRVRNRISPQTDYPHVPRDQHLTNSPGIHLAFRLPIAQPPLWRLGATAAIFLVLVTIASVFVVLSYESYLAKQPDWLLIVVSVLFTVGGGWSAFYFFRHLTLNTVIGATIVEISDHPLRPGQRFQIHVTQSGRLLLRRFEIFLACFEEATFQQGTDIRTELRPAIRKRVFQDRYFQITPGKPFTWQGEFTVPQGAMHSFQASCNSIYWKLVVRGLTRGWPRFERTFPIIVYPLGIQQRLSDGTSD